MDFNKFRKTFKMFTNHELKILKTDSQTRLQWHKACSVVNKTNQNNFETNVSLNGVQKVLERDEYFLIISSVPIEKRSPCTKRSSKRRMSSQQTQIRGQG